MIGGAVVALAVVAAPASAHTIGGPRPTNYRSHIVAIAPEVPGLSARVVDLGSKFELTNRGPTEVTVLGYEGEPYLRVGPDGVFQNQHSQATYINKTRLGGTVPVGVDTSPTATPEWKKISSGQTALWHDHRIHWMSAQPPPPVAASPGDFHHLSQQNIVLIHNGDRVAIAVALDWVPGPSGLPWIPVIVVLFVIGVVAALMPRWWGLLAVLLGVVVVSDIAHAIAFEIPRPGSNTSKILQFFGTGFVSVAVWITAVATIAMVLRKRIEALYGVVFVALLVALIGGATDLSVLWKSQLPDAGPGWLTRTEVVVALGLGGGLVVGAIVRMMRSRAAARPAVGGQWLSVLVSGLTDAELERVAAELDVDDVLPVAMRELAVRSAPVADAFSAGSLVVIVTDRGGDAWSIAANDDGLHAERGRVEPATAEIRAPFSVVLQLLAGTVSMEDATARGLAVANGDPAFVRRVEPYLPETGAVTLEDPAAAS